MVDDRETEIIPLLLADVMAAEAAEDFVSAEPCQVKTKVSFTKPEATHVILVAPRTVDQNAAPWLLSKRVDVSPHSLNVLQPLGIHGLRLGSCAPMLAPMISPWTTF